MNNEHGGRGCGWFGVEGWVGQKVHRTMKFCIFTTLFFFINFKVNVVEYKIASSVFPIPKIFFYILFAEKSLQLEGDGDCRIDLDKT